MASESGESEADQQYAKSAKGALVVILGKTATAAVLFYTGEPSPRDFDTKLRAVFGPGAETLIKELPKKPVETAAEAEPKKAV
jgi:hypothetical protein